MDWLPLHPYDIVMLGILLVMTLYGAWKGMAWQIASLTSLVLSYYMAVRYGESLGPVLSREEPWNRFLAMLVLFVVTSLVVWLLFRMAARLINRLRLQGFDRQLGMLFGLAKGVVLCLVITFFAVTMSISLRGVVWRSRSAPVISVFLRDAKPVLPERVRAVLGDYIDQMQRNLHPQLPDPDLPPADPRVQPNPRSGEPPRQAQRRGIFSRTSPPKKVGGLTRSEGLAGGGNGERPVSEVPGAKTPIS